MPRDAQARGGIGVPACARSPSVAHLEEKGIDMAVDNKKIAEDVLAAVGGASNITSATHCMTRLRLNLKDQSIPKDDEIKKIKGVLGAQCSGGQYQVIIGQNVPKVYDAAIALGVKGEGALDESLDAGAKEPLTFKSAGRAVLNYVSKSVVSLIPIMLAAAMFRTIAAICGPTMLNIWSTDSEIYNLFNNWLYNAGFYFMPIYLGWSAAKQLGASPQLGMMLGGVLIAPELLDLVNAAAESGATTTSVYGIPAMLNNYSSTVLPILLCVPVMWQVEKFFKKFVPDALATVFNPFLTMLVMVPVSLCVLAPIGSVLGDGLGNFMFSLGNAGGIATVIAIAFIAGFWEFFVMTGMHQVLITLGMAMLVQNGFDSCVFAGAMVACAASWGMAMGGFLRIREKEEKSQMLGFLISAFVGGVTEPVLYGCGFKYLRTFGGLIIGGIAGGLVTALAGCKVYVIGNASIIAAVAAYAGGGTANFVWGCVSLAVAFVVSAAVTYLFGFTREQLEADAAAATEAKALK